MSYLLMNAELEGLVCSGPRRGKQFTYALLDETVPSSETFDRREALVELAERYFVSRGPATVNDFAKWSGLTVSDARGGLEGVQSELVHEVISGKAFWFSPSIEAASKRASPVAHLMSVYDEYLSGYRDRSAIINTSGATRLSVMRNALSYLVVVRGQIVGTWNRRIEKNVVHIKTDLFER